MSLSNRSETSWCHVYSNWLGQYGKSLECLSSLMSGEQLRERLVSVSETGVIQPANMWTSEKYQLMSVWRQSGLRGPPSGSNKYQSSTLASFVFMSVVFYTIVFTLVYHITLFIACAPQVLRGLENQTEMWLMFKLVADSLDLFLNIIKALLLMWVFSHHWTNLCLPEKR